MITFILWAMILFIPACIVSGLLGKCAKSQNVALNALGAVGFIMVSLLVISVLCIV